MLGGCQEGASMGLRQEGDFQAAVNFKTEEQKPGQEMTFGQDMFDHDKG